MKKVKLFILLILFTGLGEITSPIHSLYFLSFILYVPFFYALYIYREKWWQIALLFGLLYNLIYFRWLIYPFQYTDVPAIFSYIVLLLMAFALTIFLLIFAYFFVKVLKFKNYVIAASIFTSLEIVKGVIFTGFPWGDLSYNLAQNPELIQIASFTGSYSITFIIFLINILIFDFLIFKNFKNILTAVLIFILFFIANIYIFKINTNRGIGKNILLVQGNIPEKMKFNEKNAGKIIDIYIKLTEKNLSTKTDLIIWPESIYIKFLNEDKALKEKLFNFLCKIKKPVIIGMPSIKFFDNKKYKIYNSLYLFINDKKFLKYDKVHLVPFGEYTPLKKLLFFVNKIVPGVDFSPGEKLKIVKYKDFKIIPLICFEGIFPWQILKMNKLGGNIIVNISNEAWFGNSFALYQHIAANILRAVESGKYFIRCSNSGISAIINSKGEILSKLDYNKKGVLFSHVKLFNKLSFYDKTGYFINFFFFLPIIFLLLMMQKKY